MSIERLGWTEKLKESLQDLGPSGNSRPARVVAQHRKGIVVDDGASERFISSQGRWFHGSDDRRPTVGDWVVLRESDGQIERLMERKNKLQRASKRAATPQAIASNVDIMLIVFSCDIVFNESQLERYLALGETSLVDRAVVLTKVDLYRDYARYVERVRRITFGTPIFPVNALDRSFLDDIASLLSGTLTGIFVGPSGVGKSTLVNTLAGSDVQNTQSVRVNDSKGRHTTTARNLVKLPFEGLVIDVPGTRELQLASRPAHLPQSFPDIENAIESCRFANCRHSSEPGCAVQLALRSGEFDERRLRNYMTMVG